MVKEAWGNVVMEVWEMATFAERNRWEKEEAAAMAIAEGEKLATGSVELPDGNFIPDRRPTDPGGIAECKEEDTSGPRQDCERALLALGNSWDAKTPACKTCRDTGCVTTVTQYYGRGDLGTDRVIRRTDPCPHCGIAVGVFLTKGELSDCLQFALKASLDTPSCGSSLVEKLEKALDSFK